MEIALSEQGRDVLERLRAAPRSRRAAGLPEVLRLIKSLSAHVSDVDVTALADVIQKDPVILAKVLSTAQTLGYNATGAQVYSVTQAIHIIGYARLRSLTMGFLIAQGAERGLEEHRHAAALAVCSGFVAQASAHQYFVCDPEQAFVFGCLRHFGRLVMATVLPDEYRHAPPEFDFLELGRSLLEDEKVPPGVLETLRSWSEEEDRLVALCEFSGLLAELCLVGPATPESIHALAARYGKELPDLPGLAETILSQASTHLRRFLLDRGITSLPVAALNRFCRCAGAPLSPIAESADRLTALLQDFAAQDVAVFLREGASDRYELSHGSGPFFRQLFPGLAVRAGERSLPGLCLQMRENMLIHDAADPKLAGHMPEWLRGARAPGAFALFPAIEAEGPRALVLVGWSGAQRIIPPPGYARSVNLAAKAKPKQA